jgi:tetratricopeptide (TPR) repeat protein
MNRALANVLVLAVLLGLAGGCSSKVAPALPPAAAGAPRFPEFVFPGVPERLGPPEVGATHELAWQWLQAGDLKAAERNFTAALRLAPGFYPSEAGLGYLALARKDNKEAASHFDRALAANDAYAPALAGRGEALLTLGQREQALASFEAAIAADPKLSTLRSRIEVLRFRGLQDDVDAARKAADAGRLAEARAMYERTLAASPDSPFLYRELANVEKREGNLPRALEHVQKAAELNPAEPRNLVTMAEIYEALGDYPKAVDTYTAASALEPSDAIDAKIEGLREKAAFAAMPEEYRAIETSPAVTRAQLAALFGVRLDALLKSAPRPNAVVITDMRGNWAAPWIMAVARAGLMEVYPNHTFQPNALVRRDDLAQAASKALALIAGGNPKVAASIRNARGRFPDVPQGHLSYQAVSVVVESGVMAATADGTFQLSRPVTGAEALAAIAKLEELSGRRPR